MRVLTQPRPVSECSPKGNPAKVENVVDLSDLTAYFRREHGKSRRDAGFLAREVYRDREKSAQLLPSGWHEAIHPSAVTYVRGGAILGEPLTEAQHVAWLKAGGDRA